jgi:hypothetical protein
MLMDKQIRTLIDRYMFLISSANVLAKQANFAGSHQRKVSRPGQLDRQECTRKTLEGKQGIGGYFPEGRRSFTILARYKSV